MVGMTPLEVSPPITAGLFPSSPSGVYHPTQSACTYTVAAEKSLVDGGDENTRSFPSYNYCSVPFQPPHPRFMPTIAKSL
jgi:hypothetical protein